MNEIENKKSLSKLTIIILISILLFTIATTIIIVNINSNKKNSSGGESQLSENNLTIGTKKIAVLNNEKEVNGYGLFKNNNEYVFKGGDYFLETDASGNTSKKYEQGYLNNFVKFNNNYWRIVKINSDDTIKLVWAGTYNTNKVTNLLDSQIKYIETKADNFDYENSYLRNYLNTTILNDNNIIPNNFENYLEKTSFDISTYDINSKIVTEQESKFKDYVGVLSIEDYETASYCYEYTTSTGYKTKLCGNYIADILNTATNAKQLKTNTTNVVINDNKTVGVIKIERVDGEFETNTEYQVDRDLDNNVLPVITLKSTINFESGNGSLNNPYVVK